MAKKKAADIRAQYGFVALLARRVPEIGKLLKTAVKQKWTAQRFSMSIANTRWWKKTPAPQREWLTKQITDPASANREMVNGGHDVQNRAALLGVPELSAKAARELWLDGVVRGYDDDVMNRYVFNQAKWKNNLDRFRRSSGRYGELLNGMLEQAYDYGHIRTGDLSKAPNTMSQIVRHANKIMSRGGTAQSTEWEKYLKSFAATRYSGFADRIMAGETVLDIAEPYRQTVSEVLEINHEELGLGDKLLNKAMTSREPLAIWQVEEEARRDDRWRRTDNAMEAASSAATQIGQMFGMVA